MEERLLPRDAAAPLSLRLRSFAASAMWVVVAALVYRHAPFSFHQRQFGQLYGIDGFRFTGGQFLFWATVVYLALLSIYYTWMWQGLPSKALRACVVVGHFLAAPRRTWQSGLDKEDRVALLACLLKAFFAPLMVVSMMIFCNGVVMSGLAMWNGEVSHDGWLRGPSFWLILQAILFVDVFVFTFGYLVELPRLKNEIRSVDPSLLGWGVALICYPPFNVVTNFVYGSPISDFPQFDDPTTHAVLNGLLLFMMALYAWASVAMGWKGSNLTHRGIVDDGPYRFVRHPAYICKNTAWWIGSLPVFGVAFGQSFGTGMMAVVSMASWSAIYLLRALTEEDHLKKVDGDYAAYAARVRWRFVPGLV